MTCPTLFDDVDNSTSAEEQAQHTQSRYTLHIGDCREVMATLPDSSFDMILTDPPYHKVKSDEWDNQWNTDADYLAWLGVVADQWKRLLKPNGSLYCFASPRMASRVELLIGERFNVLNRITWQKDSGWAKRQCKEEQRAFFPASEAIIFAEHYGADNIAKGEAGYAAKCDELRGFVFEPLRLYLVGERDKAGWTTRQVAEAYQRKTGSRTVTGMAGHWFEQVQWSLPTQENYEWLRNLFSGDYLRREYEDLRREYEDLRRPFSVSAEVPYTDVWTFPTVQAYKGKHPCEKPLELLRHIIRASTRPGATILDCFAGSGSTAEASIMEERQCVLIERCPHYAQKIRSRLNSKQ
jgi:adenine-specific DNA-methyltransferase